MDVRELKDQASELFRKGKFPKAAEAYLSLTKLEPRELLHFVKLGDSYRRDGQKDRAIEAYREAVDGYARQGVMIKAIATCKLILEIDPAHKRAQEALAQLCAQRYARPGDAPPPPPLPPPRPRQSPPPPQPTKREIPESIELPDEPETELELDTIARPDPKKDAKQAERALPAIRHEAPRPPPPKEPVRPPVVQPVTRAAPPRAFEPIELPDDAGSVDVDMAPSGTFAAVAAPDVKEITGIDLGFSLTDSTSPPAPSQEIEIIDGDDLPPGVTMPPSATNTAEHEVLRRAMAAADAPMTAMASILAARVDDDLYPMTISATHTKVAAPASPPSMPPAPRPTFGDNILNDLHRATSVAAGSTSIPAIKPPAAPLTSSGASIPSWGRPPPPQSVAVRAIDAHQAAHLAEEAAFEPPLPHVEPTGPVETALAAIPSSDLHQEDVPLFSQLPKDAFIDLLEQLTFRRMSSGDMVVREGDVGKSIYVLASGTARVVKGLGTEHPLQLAKLEEGAFFGEMALLNGAPRVASVVATTDIEVLELTEAILNDLTKKHPSVGESLKKFYRQRLLANVMAISPLFRSFDKTDRKALVEKFKLREVPAGDTIIKEGQPTDGLYVVMHGAALVTKKDGARIVPLAALKEGDVFGEMSLLTHNPTIATVTTKRKTLVLRLPKAAWDELMFTHPGVLEVVSELSEQRTRVNEQILSGVMDSPREATAFL